MKYEKFQCSVPRLPREGEGPGKRGGLNGSMHHYAEAHMRASAPEDNPLGPKHAKGPLAKVGSSIDSQIGSLVGSNLGSTI